MKSPANLSRAALNLLNDFLMRSCVPINARRKISLNRPNYEECEIMLHSACVSSWERLRLKSSLSRGYVLRAFCTFVYKMGSFGGHEVNGFVDVAPRLTNWRLGAVKILEWKHGKTYRQILYICPHKRKYQDYERNIDKNTKGFDLFSSAWRTQRVGHGCCILGTWCWFLHLRC